MGSGREEAHDEWEEAEWRDLDSRGAAYFHGSLPRQVAERVVQDHGEFLVRFNEKEKSHEFVVSVRWDGVLRHFKLMKKRDGSGVWIRKDKSFRRIHDLIQNYFHGQEAIAAVDEPDEEPPMLRRPVGRDRWELQSKNIELKNVLGAGAFGQVW